MQRESGGFVSYMTKDLSSGLLLALVDLKDQGNPNLVNDIGQWESLVDSALIYWPNLYIQLNNAKGKLVFEYTSGLDASVRLDRELDILLIAMNHG